MLMSNCCKESFHLVAVCVCSHFTAVLWLIDMSAFFFFEIVCDCTVTVHTLLKIHLNSNNKQFRMRGQSSWLVNTKSDWFQLQPKKSNRCPWLLLLFFFFSRLLFWRPVFSFSRWFSARVQAGCRLSERTKSVRQHIYSIRFFTRFLLRFKLSLLHSGSDMHWIQVKTRVTVRSPPPHGHE